MIPANSLPTAPVLRSAEPQDGMFRLGGKGIQGNNHGGLVKALVDNAGKHSIRRNYSAPQSMGRENPGTDMSQVAGRGQTN